MHRNLKYLARACLCVREFEQNENEMKRNKSVNANIWNICTHSSGGTHFFLSFSLSFLIHYQVWFGSFFSPILLPTDYALRVCSFKFFGFDKLVENVVLHTKRTAAAAATVFLVLHHTAIYLLAHCMFDWRTIAWMDALLYENPKQLQFKKLHRQINE